jgi:hypothetical protein
MGQEIPRKATPISTSDAATLITEVLHEVLGELPGYNLAAYMLAYAWFETGGGKSIQCYNWGNISTMPSWGHDYWRPPWFEVTEDSSARNRHLHEEMLAGRAPQAFRAYHSHDEGLKDYVKFLTGKERYQPVVNAMAAGDAAALGRAIKATSYCPDCSPSVVKRNVEGFIRQFEAESLFADLPKAPSESQEPAPPSPSSPSPATFSFEPYDLEYGHVAKLHRLEKGCKGSQVVLLQVVFLRESELLPDGLFGAKTRLAVIERQRELGLKKDGIVGPKTWAAFIEEA